jgi:hypothetical protein
MIPGSRTKFEPTHAFDFFSSVMLLKTHTLSEGGCAASIRHHTKCVERLLLVELDRACLLSDQWPQPSFFVFVLTETVQPAEMLSVLMKAN